MKLKKIASLMLAGVMAVSMLAGCSGNGSNNNNNNNDDPVVNTGMTGKVIAALDKDTTDKVAFTASSSLEIALQKAVQNVGSDVVGNAGFAGEVMTELTKINPDLTSTEFVGGTEENDKKEQSYTCVQLLNNSDIGASEEYAAAKLADMVEATEADGVKALADLGTFSKDYDSGKYFYSFDYTGDMAVVEVTNAVTGQTSYISVVTITRTPTKVEK